MQQGTVSEDDEAFDYWALSDETRAYLDALRAMTPEAFQRHRRRIEGPWLSSRQQAGGLKGRGQKRA